MAPELRLTNSKVYVILNSWLEEQLGRGGIRGRGRLQRGRLLDDVGRWHHHHLPRRRQNTSESIAHRGYVFAVAHQQSTLLLYVGSTAWRIESLSNNGSQ